MSAVPGDDLVTRLRETLAEVERVRAWCPVLVGPAAVLSEVAVQMPWFPADKLVPSQVTDGQVLVIAPHLLDPPVLTSALWDEL